MALIKWTKDKTMPTGKAASGRVYSCYVSSTGAHLFYLGKMKKTKNTRARAIAVYPSLNAAKSVAEKIETELMSKESGTKTSSTMPQAIKYKGAKYVLAKPTAPKKPAAPKKPTPPKKRKKKTPCGSCHGEGWHNTPSGTTMCSNCRGKGHK